MICHQPYLQYLLDFFLLVWSCGNDDQPVQQVNRDTMRTCVVSTTNSVVKFRKMHHVIHAQILVLTSPSIFTNVLLTFTHHLQSAY